MEVGLLLISQNYMGHKSDEAMVQGEMRIAELADHALHLLGFHLQGFGVPLGRGSGANGTNSCKVMFRLEL